MGWRSNHLILLHGRQVRRLRRRLRYEREQHRESIQAGVNTILRQRVAAEDHVAALEQRCEALQAEKDNRERAFQ